MPNKNSYYQILTSLEAAKMDIEIKISTMIFFKRQAVCKNSPNDLSATQFEFRFHGL